MSDTNIAIKSLTKNSAMAKSNNTPIRKFNFKPVIPSDSDFDSDSDTDSDSSSDDDDDSLSVKALSLADFEPKNEFGVRMRTITRHDGTVINTKLKPHQIPTIKWMIEREANPISGVCGGMLCLSMGLGKCQKMGTKNLLWNGDIKKVEDIKVGDLLIGDDSTPRTVLSICNGRDKMYNIKQHKGEDYGVNEAHILSLKISGHRGFWLTDKTYHLSWIDIKTMKQCGKTFSMTEKSKYYSQTKKGAYDNMMIFKETIPDIPEHKQTLDHKTFTDDSTGYSLCYYELLTDEEKKDYIPAKIWKKASKSFSVANYKTKELAYNAMIKFKTTISSDKTSFYFGTSGNKYKFQYFIDTGCLEPVPTYKQYSKKFTVSSLHCGYKTLEEAYNAMIEYRNSIDPTKVIDISVKDYLTLPESIKDILKGYKVGVNWPSCPVELNPYILGLWLGDGSSSGNGFTNQDSECVNEFRNYIVDELDGNFTKVKGSNIQYSISGKLYSSIDETDMKTKYRSVNKFVKKLRFYNLLEQSPSDRVLGFNLKHIPRSYLINDRETRLELLAGLIDTDGYFNDGCYEIVQKSKRLSDHILYLVRSLGFNADQVEVEKECVNNGVWGIYHNVCFSGEGIDDIPCRILYKKAPPRKQKKNALVTRIKVEYEGEGEYYGFTLDGNHRYLLNDFTVTHNTVCALTIVMRDYTLPDSPKFPTLVVCPLSAIYTWKEQIDTFFGSTCPYLIVRRELMGKAMDTLTLEKLCKYKVIITNYETIRTIASKNNIYDDKFDLDASGRRIGINPADPPTASMMEKTGPIVLFNIPWHRTIADESHTYSNPKSALFYSMMCLYSKRKWGLTGTPLRNFASDIYAQFRVVGFNDVLTQKKFNIDLYSKANLDKCVLYMTKEDAKIELPELKTITVPIVLEGKEREIYEYFKKSTKEAHEGFLTGCVNFANVLTLFLRLRQCCISAYTITNKSSRGYNKNTQPEQQDYTHSQQVLDGITSGLASWIADSNGTAGIQSAKVVAAINIIKQIPVDEKIIVFTSFKRLIDILERALVKECPSIEYEIIDGDVTGGERNSALDRFKKTKTRVLFISYKVGSESLNLTEGTRIILMETVWCPSTIQQASARSHRVGQDKEVIVYQLVAKDTIEQKMLDICEKKIKLFDQFITSKKNIEVKMDASMLRYMLLA